MNLKLDGRKVVITGGSEGIGRALALAFAGEGARVAVCARNFERLNTLSKTIEGRGHLFETADLTQTGDIKNFHQKVTGAFGGLDVLVNNLGGIQKAAGFAELTDEDWLEAFNLNLLSAVRMIRIFMPSLKSSGAPRIINISSIAAIRPGELFPHYSAMKAALSNLTSSLARTLAPEKILVNAISPGPVWTPSWETQARQEAQAVKTEPAKARQALMEETARNVPLQRMGLPEDVPGLVLFLASDRANWITAANFTIDGGIIQDTF